MVHNNPVPYLTSLSFQDIPKDFNSTFLNPCWYEPPTGNKRVLVCLPYYFVAGFTKCGTTDLYYRMALHPQIYLGSVKEPTFWSKRWLEELKRNPGTSKRKVYNSILG
jgi:N-acetylgalactosamine 4-sulfate 6-O-sulfotransferase